MDELGRTKSCFSIENKEIINNQTDIFHPWDLGKTGVPLVWNPKEKTVRVDHTDSHSLVVGPTGSKKSRLVVMPLVRILGSSGESMIISDPKAEIYNRTAGYLQKQGYTIYTLNLRSPMHGQRWNPLTIPYEFYMSGEADKAYEFVNDIAENLINSQKSDKDPFWDNSAGSFFFGLVVLLFKYCKEHQLGKEYVHMGNVIRLRNLLITESNNWRTSQLWSYAKSDYIIATSLVGTVETAKDTKAGILSVFDQKVRMFSIQPSLLDMLGENEIDFDAIGTKPTAIFLIVPDEKTGYHGLVSLFVKQSYEYMVFNAQQIAERDGTYVGVLANRVNYVLDEFSSIPTIRDFPAMVTAARSRNIRFTVVIQSKHQLIQKYGDESETIQTNCNNWIFLTSRELQLLEEISSLCGKTVGDNPQPVLSIADLQRLDKEKGEALLLCGREKPCITILADIEEYDNNQFEKVPVTRREQHTPPEIAFESAEEPIRFDPERHIRVGNGSLDEMIKEIDARIAELDREASSEDSGSDEKSDKSEE